MDDNKPLDALALVIVLIGVLFVVLGVVLRSYLNELSHQQQIESMQGYQGVWIALPDYISWLPNEDNPDALNPNPSNQQSNQYNQRIDISKTDLNLKSDFDHGIATMSFVPNAVAQDANKQSTNLWLRLVSGDVLHCQLELQFSGSQASGVQVTKPCEPIMENTDSYKSIIGLPNANQVLLVDNYTTAISSRDATTGQNIKSNISYTVPTDDNLMLDMIGSIDGWQEGKLYRANQGMIANDISINNGSVTDYYIQADTGNSQIVAWQMEEDGTPKFEQPASVWLSTNQQPYYFAYLSHPQAESDPKQRIQSKWIVLESEIVLTQGKIQEYTIIAGEQIGDQRINIPLKDPTLLTQDGHHVFVVEQATGKISHLNYDSFVNPVMQEWQPTSMVQSITEVYTLKNRLEWAGRLAMILLIAPFLAIFVLYFMGYNLNQRLN